MKLPKRNANWTFTDIILHFNGFYFDFCNSEAMMALPQNLAFDSQPRFGLTQVEFLNIYNFLINKRIFINFLLNVSLSNPHLLKLMTIFVIIFL